MKVSLTVSHVGLKYTHHPHRPNEINYLPDSIWLQSYYHKIPLSWGFTPPLTQGARHPRKPVESQPKLPTDLSRIHDVAR